MICLRQSMLDMQHFSPELRMNPIQGFSGTFQRVGTWTVLQGVARNVLVACSSFLSRIGKQPPLVQVKVWDPSVVILLKEAQRAAFHDVLGPLLKDQQVSEHHRLSHLFPVLDNDRAPSYRPASGRATS